MWRNGDEILLSKSSGSDLAYQIEKLFNSEKLRFDISEGAYRKSLKYDWENVKLLWLNLFKD